MSTPTRLRFTKMHGTGNDFVVLNGVTQHIHLTQAMIRAIACRKTGIGCDQVLLLEPPYEPQTDFAYRIFNADGSEVTQCGNGARCIGRFAYEEGLTALRELKLETQVDVLSVDIQDLSSIQVNLGKPRLNPADVPIQAKPLQDFEYTLPLKDGPKTGWALNVGNPHCVVFVGALDDPKLEKYAQTLQSASLFPEGVNVSFVHILARNHIKLRVFERGSGETASCGSAACAAVISGFYKGQTGERTQVEMPGGRVMVDFDSTAQSVHLSGPTKTVAIGHFVLNQE